MSAEPGLPRFVAERIHLPPMTFDETFYWDGIGPMSRDGGPMRSSKQPFPSRHAAPSWAQAPIETQREMATGWHARLLLTSGDVCPVGSAAPRGIDWAQEAECLTVSLDPGVFIAAARDSIPGATGELVWIYREGQAQSITLYVHPVLLIHTTSDRPQMDRVEIVPHLHASDPLLHHMMLVLQAAIDANGVAGRLYTEALTNALAVHLLRRFETCRPPAQACPGRLSKPKLRRMTAYIETHLAEELSVTKLAAVAQTSPTYFARLFRQATGQTLGQYVIMCRIERAKRLLRETEWPIIEIGHRVGFTDQSYFTAVFRKHVATTPKAYRGAPPTVVTPSTCRRVLSPPPPPPMVEMASRASPPSAQDHPTVAAMWLPL